MGLFGDDIERPVQGWAEIVETWLPPRSGAVGNCRMKLRLDVPGIPPQVVRHHEWAVMPQRWPEKGMRVAVTVDADHPDRIEVDWESMFGEVRGGPLGVAAELVGSHFGVEMDLSKGVQSDHLPSRLRQAPPPGVGAGPSGHGARRGVNSGLPR